MKKFLLSLAVILLTATTVQAQSHKVLNFGVKVGANMSTLTELQDWNSTFKTGFTAGLFFELRPIKLVGVSIDALYSSAGTKFSFENWSADINLGYIDLPIMAKVYLFRGLSVNAGVMPSFLINSSISHALFYFCLLLML